MKQTCKKCGHKWLARVEKPKQCPRCKNYLPSKSTSTLGDLLPKPKDD